MGKAGDIQAELQAIILDNNLDVLPYQQELLRELPDNDVLTDIDIKDREDWRHECIFTIDPATAVDLDDAVSCKILNNGNYEVIECIQFNRSYKPRLFLQALISAYIFFLILDWSTHI